METIINILTGFAREHLIVHVLLIFFTTLLLSGSMVIDLISGVKKAKENGVARTSAGYKMTCTKAQKYFSPYLELICIDLVCCIILPIPIFSMGWAAYCMFCEYKSVREKSWQKAELRQMKKTMNVVIENKDDIVNLVAEVMKANNVKSENDGKP